MIQRSPRTAGCRFTGLKRGLSLQLANFNKASGPVRSSSRNKSLLPALPEEPSGRLLGGPVVTVADSTPPTTRLTVTKPFSSPVSHPIFLIGSLATYSFIAFDVFAPNSLHLLQPIDQALHEATLANIDPEVRRTLFAGVFSNWWIISGAIGWIFTTATASSRYNPLAWQACALGWALWIFGVGPIEHDPALMDLLKTGFGRVRPSPIHRTASFPSGHTAAVVLIMGALLFVLLPVVFRSKLSSRDQDKDISCTGQADDGSAGEGCVTRMHPLFKAIYSAQYSWSLWGLATATTIVGRVGVDAHWLSDTLAGAALSVALVAGLAGVTERLAEGMGTEAAERGKDPPGH